MPSAFVTSAGDAEKSKSGPTSFGQFGLSPNFALPAAGPGARPAAAARSPGSTTSGMIWFTQRILPVVKSNATIASLVRGAGSAYALPVAA